MKKFMSNFFTVTFNFLLELCIFRYSSSTSNSLRDQSFVELKPLPREPMPNSDHYGSLPVVNKKTKKKTFGGKSKLSCK